MHDIFIRFRLTRAGHSVIAHSGSGNREVIKIIEFFSLFLFSLIGRFHCLLCKLHNGVKLVLTGALVFCAVFLTLVLVFFSVLLLGMTLVRIVQGILAMDEAKNGLSLSPFPVLQRRFFLPLEQPLLLFFLSFLSLRGPCFLEAGSSNKDYRCLQNVTKSLIVPSWGSNPCRCMACCHLRGTPNSSGPVACR